MVFLRSLAETGVNFANSLPERRGIMLANGVSIIISSFSFLLFGLYFFWYGWSPVTGIIGVSALLCLSTILLNKTGNIVLSRFWLCVFIPLSSTALSIYSKTLYYHLQEELDYFSFRFFILASCVFPVIFFSFKEKIFLISSTAMSFLILVSFDPLHELFEVPYRVGTLKVSNYSFTNVVIVITYFVMVGAVFIMKWISERSEDRAEKLIFELNEINEDLLEKNTEIEAQNQEIYLQAENLGINQRKLRDANALIAEQRELLFRQNQNLSTELLDKNKNLTDTNTELIKHINELRQFSFAVSHNLRGPVASLIGLVNLIDGEHIQHGEKQVFTHIKSTLSQLDNIIRDLSKIIDIRNDIFRLRQKIELPAELNEIAKLFKNEIDTHHIVIKADFSDCSEIYSVKALVHSILYNLISNAIKYRSSERQPCIEIKSKVSNEFYILEVKDNGLGIDLATHRENLFKLYKRFHYHTEGKGLGLYLIKLQVETLGGQVEVESEINKETTFRITLKKPDNVERQILYEEPYAQIFYDARINSTGVIWNGPVTSQQYRSAFVKCLEFVKLYNTPNYIADLSRQGPVSREDQLWMFQEIMPDATSNGLKRIAAIRPDKNELIVQEYLRGINDTLNKLGARQELFLSMEEASNWIEEENIKASLNIPV